METSRLIQFAKAYKGLGWAVQQQLDSILDDDLSDLNENAVTEMYAKLNGYDGDLDDMLKGALQTVRS